MPGDLSGGGLRLELSRSAMGIVAIKIVFTVLSLAVSILLARALGPEAYGIYAYALALVVLLAQFATAGLPTLLVREVAAMQAREEWGRLSSIIGWSRRIVLTLSLAFAALVFLLLPEDRATPRFSTLAWALALLPFLALAEWRAAILRGMRKVVWSQLPDFVVKPFLHGCFLLALTIAAASPALTPAAAMASHVAAAAAAFFAGALLFKYHARPCGNRPAAQPEPRRWLASAFPLGVAGALQMANQQTDILMLDWFGTADDVGVYKAAAQGASLVVFLLDGLNIALAPHVSRLYALGEMQKLQRLLTLSARFSLAAALPLALMLVFLGDHLLGFVIGDNYRRGHAALAILCAGQVLNAGMGSVGLLLNMTGFEKDMARGLLFTTLCNLLLNLTLTPLFGMEGAAASTAASLVVWNLFMLRRARLRLGLVSLAFPVKSWK